MKLSPKQIQTLKTPLKTINIFWGVTGSGKSFITNLLTYGKIVNAPYKANILLTGNSTETLYKNVVKELEIIDDGINDISVSRRPLSIYCKRNQVEVFCYGLNVEGREKSINGGIS